MGSYTQLAYHIIFGTKYRRPQLVKSLRDDLYEFFGGVLRRRGGRVMEIGGVEDHVHLLATLSPRYAIADVIGETKGVTSNWMNDRKATQGKFRWQKGYGAFTVSYSAVDAVRKYIQGQEEHHLQQSFPDEFVEFLCRHDLDFQMERLFEDEFFS